jgi:hypothetical protein
MRNARERQGIGWRSRKDHRGLVCQHFANGRFRVPSSYDTPFGAADGIGRQSVEARFDVVIDDFLDKRGPRRGIWI